jgi:hypothetical protein
MTASESARQKYSDAYQWLRKQARAGRILSLSGMILALPLLWLAVFDHWIRFEGVVFLMVLAGFVALMGMGIGWVVKAQARVLEATLDTAVNTSAFLTEADRRDLLSLTTKLPWSEVGIGSLKQDLPVEQAALRGWHEQRPYESPVEFLISANREPLRTVRPVSQRLHRQLTRRR